MVMRVMNSPALSLCVVSAAHHIGGHAALVAATDATFDENGDVRELV